jgi:hypothetical protein
MFRPEMLLPMGLPEGVNVIGRTLDLSEFSEKESFIIILGS